jgi:hypothetical protein
MLCRSSACWSCVNVVSSYFCCTRWHNHRWYSALPWKPPLIHTALEAALDTRFAALQADMAAQFAAMNAQLAAINAHLVLPGGINLELYRHVNKAKVHTSPFVPLPDAAGNFPPAPLWPAAGLCYDAINTMPVAPVNALLHFYGLPVAGLLGDKRVTC